MKIRFSIVILAVCFGILSSAHQLRHPRHTVKSNQPQIGNPIAPVGGTFTIQLDSQPQSLNPMRTPDGYGQQVEGYCFDSLLQHNIQTYDYEPSLAEKWEVSKDGKSYTFYLRKHAKFTNGEPITAADVKFSFDAFNNPSLADAVEKVYFENIDHVDVLGPYKVRFVVKKKYFLNLDVISGMAILPKTAYGNPSNHMAHEIVGSGPYKLERYEIGKQIVLVRNDDWWGFKTPQNSGYYKFKKIVFKIITDENAKLEAFKRGDLDFLGLSPEQFVKKTDGAPWGQTIFKRQVKNSAPQGQAFIGFNLKNPLFKDRQVRRALSLLFNRPLLIQKFFYDKYEVARGPWYSKSPDADPKAKPYAYNPKLARELLKKAGWADTNHDGVLDKMVDGHRVDFRFTILNAGGPWARYLTIYQQDLKKAGIDVAIKVEDWNSFETSMDERKFEAVALAWGGVVYNDPKQIWSSSSNSKTGSNFISYSNPEVDRLIDQARVELNTKKRLPLMHKIFSLIRNDYPYIFLWSPNYSLYAYDKRMLMEVPTYKYGVGTETWWTTPSASVSPQ